MVAIDVLPIARTEVDWTKYLTAAHSILGRSVTESLDEKGQSAVGLPAFLASIAELQKRGSDPLRVLRTGTSNILNHASFSFLVLADKTVWADIATLTSLTITSYKEIAVISGTLQYWKEALVQTLKPEVNINVRTVFSKIFILFDRQGLGELWGYYSRKGLDGTFILEPKE